MGPFQRLDGQKDKQIGRHGQAGRQTVRKTERKVRRWVGGRGRLAFVDSYEQTGTQP